VAFKTRKIRRKENSVFVINSFEINIVVVVRYKENNENSRSKKSTSRNTKALKRK